MVNILAFAEQKGYYVCFYKPRENTTIHLPCLPGVTHVGRACVLKS
jgi:hypothetical protein